MVPVMLHPLKVAMPEVALTAAEHDWVAPVPGWVAMWRPMEIYLYDWWPLKRRGTLLSRLSRMKVEVTEGPR